MTELLKRLFQHLPKERRIELYLTLVLVIIASLAEAISIGAVVPFLAVLTSPTAVFNYQGTQPFISLLKLSSPTQLALPLTIAFGIAAILAGTTRLLLIWVMTRWSYAAGSDLSISIYQRTLYQPYETHITRNSSEIISGISNKVNGVISNLLQALNLVGAVVILAGALLTLLIINPNAALVAIIGFGIIYTTIMRMIRGRLNYNSKCVARESNQVIKTLQEGLGGIRDILINGSQSIFCEQYREADVALRRAQGSNSFLSSSPRFLVETMCMLLIASLAYSISQLSGGLDDAVPILGAIALGAQRMLPATQTAYASWVSLKGGAETLQDAIELLEQPLPNKHSIHPQTPLRFMEKIELNGISFGYRGSEQWILRDIDLTIRKGSRIGFVGATGTGKSTLLDIIMGLLQPSQGTLSIDGNQVTNENIRHWQACISHVPQSIFLIDSSVEANIAFGVDAGKVDKDRVILAAKQAQIHELIEGLQDGYNTKVGENGVRLSGGQRQRIGIARALYRNAEVIIFDEATSALDTKTEEKIIKAIESLNPDITILMIAHRITTLSSCTKIIEFEKNGIRNVGTYKEFTDQVTK